MLSELNITRFLTVFFIFLLVSQLGKEEEHRGSWGSGWMTVIGFLIGTPIFICLCCILYKLTLGNLPAEPLKYLLVTVTKMVAICLAVPVLLLKVLLTRDKMKQRQNKNLP